MKGNSLQKRNHTFRLTEKIVKKMYMRKDKKKLGNHVKRNQDVLKNGQKKIRHSRKCVGEKNLY